jgi:predicted nucleic acid-binding protein
MPVRVVDASALGALVFAEPKAEKIARDLEGSSLVAPALLWFEVASICLKKVTAHRSQREEILTAFSLARELPIQMVDVDHGAVVELARATGLTTYDASYLWTVQQVGGKLVTLDDKLQKAVAR